MKKKVFLTLFVFCITASATVYSQQKGGPTVSQVNMDIRDSDPVQVKVVYCGPCGYFAKVNTLKTDIENRFGSNVNFSLESTPTYTGYFEVSVNNSLVHSKKNGDGYVDTTEKKDKILNAIENALGN